MDEISELGDWEFLQPQEPNSSSNTTTINSNYFTLPSSEEHDTDEGGVDSDNPSSHGETGENPIHESVFTVTESRDSSSSDEEISKDDEPERNRGSWWEVVKFCVLKVKPSWCFSAIGIILGFVLIKRRMNRIAEKKKTSASVRVPTDEKRISKFAVRANHMNEDLRRVPIIRTSPSAGTGTITWSLLAFR